MTSEARFFLGRCAAGKQQIRLDTVLRRVYQQAQALQRLDYLDLDVTHLGIHSLHAQCTGAQQIMLHPIANQ